MLSADLADAHTRDLLQAAAEAYPVRGRQRPARRRARALADRLRAHR